MRDDLVAGQGADGLLAAEDGTAEGVVGPERGDEELVLRTICRATPEPQWKELVEAIVSQAGLEDARSRIYLGIHWAFDKTEGIDQGRRVANYVIKNAFTPRGGSDPH